MAKLVASEEVPISYLYTFLNNTVALVVYIYYLYYMSKADVKDGMLHGFCSQDKAAFGLRKLDDL